MDSPFRNSRDRDAFTVLTGGLAIIGGVSALYPAILTITAAAVWLVVLLMLMRLYWEELRNVVHPSLVSPKHLPNHAGIFSDTARALDELSGDAARIARLEELAPLVRISQILFDQRGYCRLSERPFEAWCRRLCLVIQKVWNPPDAEGLSKELAEYLVRPLDKHLSRALVGTRRDMRRLRNVVATLETLIQRLATLVEEEPDKRTHTARFYGYLTSAVLETISSHLARLDRVRPEIKSRLNVLITAAFRLPITKDLERNEDHLLSTGELLWPHPGVVCGLWSLGVERMCGVKGLPSSTHLRFLTLGLRRTVAFVRRMARHLEPRARATFVRRTIEDRVVQLVGCCDSALGDASDVIETTCAHSLVVELRRLDDAVTTFDRLHPDLIGRSRAIEMAQRVADQVLKSALLLSPGEAAGSSASEMQV